MALRDPTRLFEGEISPRAGKLARAVSVLTLPPVVSIPVQLILSLVCDGWAEYAEVAGLTVFFNAFLVMAMTLAFSRRTGNEDGDIYRKEDRIVPMAIGVALYAVCTALLWAIGAPRIITVLEACYVVVTAVMGAISLRWKISLHACGLIGPGLAMCLAFGPVGLATYAFVPLICWARYVQRKHTPAQLLGGILCGLSISAAMFALLLRGPASDIKQLAPDAGRRAPAGDGRGGG